MSDPRRILVTGGAGFTGSHCVRLLCEQGHTVVVYDNLSSGYRQSLPDDVTLVRGDLRDRIQLSQCFDGHTFDAIVHLAGVHDNHASIGQPQHVYESNVLGSMNLIGEAMKHDIRRLVFRSTCAVYGTQPDGEPLSEDAAKHPITPFGRTKWVVEMALQDCARSDGLGSVALRCFNTAGAAADGSIGEAHRHETHLIPSAIGVALGQAESLVVYGDDYPTADGSAVRDFVHVDDVARAIVAALDVVEPGRATACNIGTSAPTSVLAALAHCRQATAHDIPTRTEARREGDVATVLADIARAEKELGWRPQHGIEDMVASAWRWHQANPDGFDE